jgi:hypothetical protein
MNRAMLAVVLVLLTAPCAAESIRVDAAQEHVTNTIRPTEALGAGVDRLPYGAADKLLKEGTIRRILSAGWQTVTYRQNTELHTEAWHWNPRGTWSEAGARGYFVGDALTGKEKIIHSYGYPLPRRGVTRDDGTDTVGYSRLTDGDPATFWKSNPYLSGAFTGAGDAAHPQWIMLDLLSKQDLQAIRIDWAEPYAKQYLVQFWTGEDPIKKPAAGSWQLFPHGRVAAGQGGHETLALADRPVTAQFIRILMTGSSNTCVNSNSRDRRDCVGYAIGEISLGSLSSDGRFHDLIRHTPDQDQTATYCSSVDPWHESRDLDEKAGEQIGLDRFFTSGITRGLPAMIPIAMIYSTPEDAVAELKYLESRGYPISYVEMGEEPDGHYTVPEDYAELYLQFAAALHKFDPKLKLGGPIFTGQNEDIQTWPDADGNASWTNRFINYLTAHGKLGELAFVCHGRRAVPVAVIEGRPGVGENEVLDRSTAIDGCSSQRHIVACMCGQLGSLVREHQRLRDDTDRCRGRLIQAPTSMGPALNAMSGVPGRAGVGLVCKPLRLRCGRPPAVPGHVHELPGAVAIRIAETHIRRLKLTVFYRLHFRCTSDAHDAAARGCDLLPFRSAGHWVEVQPPQVSLWQG